MSIREIFADRPDLTLEYTNMFFAQKKITDTPIVKHPTATQGLNRSPVPATTIRSISLTNYNTFQQYRQEELRCFLNIFTVLLSYSVDARSVGNLISHTLSKRPIY